MPPQRPAMRYDAGASRLADSATYASEKSFVASAHPRAPTATATRSAPVTLAAVESRRGPISSTAEASAAPTMAAVPTRAVIPPARRPDT
jgi:hypothetical protein